MMHMRKILRLFLSTSITKLCLSTHGILNMWYWFENFKYFKHVFRERRMTPLAFISQVSYIQFGKLIEIYILVWLFRLVASSDSVLASASCRWSNWSIGVFTDYLEMLLIQNELYINVTHRKFWKIKIKLNIEQSQFRVTSLPWTWIKSSMFQISHTQNRVNHNAKEGQRRKGAPQESATSLSVA